MDLNNFDYDDLIAKAKRIDPVNFMDIVHDFLLDGGSLKNKSFNYYNVNGVDLTKKEFTGDTNTCRKCNEIKPVAAFRTVQSKSNGSLYLCNTCTECHNKIINDYARERYKTDEAYREYFKAYLVERYRSDKTFREKCKERQRNYRKNASSEWHEKERIRVRTYYANNKERLRAKARINRRIDYQNNREKYLRAAAKYREKNRDRINQKKRENYYRNREKILEQQKKYKLKKKLNKDLLECPTTLQP